MANAARHRDKIIQAAIRLYREKGYASTGLSEILTLSGAPKGSLYYYFPGGKEELTVEAIRVAGTVVANTLRDLSGRAKHPSDFIRSYCQLLADWMGASGFKSGCPIATTVLETVPFSAAITRACQNVFNDWALIVAAVFERAGSSKSEANDKAEQVIAAVEGSLLLARVKQSTKPILAVPAMIKI